MSERQATEQDRVEPKQRPPCPNQSVSGGKQTDRVSWSDLGLGLLLIEVVVQRVELVDSSLTMVANLDLQHL